MCLFSVFAASQKLTDALTKRGILVNATWEHVLEDAISKGKIECNGGSSAMQFYADLCSSMQACAVLRNSMQTYAVLCGATYVEHCTRSH